MAVGFRFSLRASLVVVAVVAALLYWALAPTFKAQQYVRALNASDYLAADRLCPDPNTRFPGDWTVGDMFEVRASIRPLSWSNIWQGTRNISVAITHCQEDGMSTSSVACKATRTGVAVVHLLP